MAVTNLLGRVRADLSEEGHLNRDLNEVKERVMQIFEKRAFQKESTARLKALRLALANCV